jgi:hypothetical protein
MRSTMTTSRPKSVHPNTGAVQGYDEQPDDVPGESLGDRHKRRWKAFHEGRGVRTVVGDIAGAKEGELESNLTPVQVRAPADTWYPFAVRMLLKAGYRYVYVSRPFAMSKGLIPKTVRPLFLLRTLPPHPNTALFCIAAVRYGNLRIRRIGQPWPTPYHRRIEDGEAYRYDLGRSQL